MTIMFSTSCATNALCGALEVGEYANTGLYLLCWAEGILYMTQRTYRSVYQLTRQIYTVDMTGDLVLHPYLTQ